MQAAVRLMGGPEEPGPPPPAWVPAPESGMAIGPYVVVNAIGQGGMGIVYKARRHPMSRPVAIKMLRAGVNAGYEAVVRFRREGRAAGLLNHPNIVHLYEVGEHGGVLYYAMERVDGCSLAVKLTACPLPVRTAAEVVGTLAAAIDYTHQMQVVHRDLKPSNVLLTADGVPKVADFGLAKLADGDLARWLRNERPLGIPGPFGRARRALVRGRRALLLGLVLLPAVPALVLLDPDRRLEPVMNLGGPVP